MQAKAEPAGGGALDARVARDARALYWTLLMSGMLKWRRQKYSAMDSAIRGVSSYSAFVACLLAAGACHVLSAPTAPQSAPPRRHFLSGPATGG